MSLALSAQTPEQTHFAVPAYAQILGFPLEAASVLLLPYFGVKYLIDKDDVKDDIGNVVVSHLPPLVYNHCHGHCEPCLYVFKQCIPRVDNAAEQVREELLKRCHTRRTG